MFLRSSDEQRAMQLREAHREKVARNEVQVSPLWAQPARGYNVHIELDPLQVSAGENTAEPLPGRAQPAGVSSIRAST